MPIEKQLPPKDFNTVVRWIKTQSIERVKELVPLLTLTMARVGARPNFRRIVNGPAPAGSDQFDVGSIATWLRGVNKQDKWAIKQVVALDATIRARLGG